MKISIDTDNKVIELSERANIKELWTMVNKMFGDDAQNWEVELQQIHTSPGKIPPGPIPRTPSNRVVTESEPDFDSMKVDEGNIMKAYEERYSRVSPPAGFSFEAS